MRLHKQLEALYVTLGLGGTRITTEPDIPALYGNFINAHHVNDFYYSMLVMRDALADAGVPFPLPADVTSRMERAGAAEKCRP
jgi:hypothetical protein